MTRHKTLLLAGTILPALLLLPASGVFAQATDQNDRPQRQHREGGPGGEGGPRAQGGGERGGAERGGPGGGGGEHRRAREDAQGAPAGGPAGGGGERRRAREDAQGAPAGGAEHRGRAADTERPNRGEAQRAEEPKANRKAPGEGPKANQADESGRPGRAERKERRENAQERNAAPAATPPAATAQERKPDAPRGAARDNARDNNNDERGNGARRRDNADRDNGPRDGGPRDGGPRVGGRDGAGDNGPRGNRADDRRPGGPEERQRAGERGRDNAGDGRGPRDNAGRDPDRRLGNDDRRGGPGGPGVSVGIGPGGVGVGIGGGFLPPTQARRLDDLRRDRREVREGDSTFIREPGRTIVQERGRSFIVHDETDRFRSLGYNVRRERRGADFVDVTTRPGGDEILSFTDGQGRLLRRVRRGRDGREVVIIDNGVGRRVADYDQDVIVLPPPPLRIPRDRYIVDYRDANASVLYDTLIAPPLAAPPRRYTLDQIRYSPDVRNYVRSVDINTINFDSGSWDVPAAATGKLEALATAINRAVDRNPNSVFLIEGYTDATGNPNDNLSLSDRRAQSVAEILTKDFKVPPENLTTQGYGQQNPKENTSGPSAANRRVVVRNITQLLAAGGPANGQ